ncbi:MAG: cell division protein FtsZ, partial [Candidatus Cloacimonetes bacterium]|nr:cell division protein FtsZ [Candidatus Cloacimonadota bacterium]
MFEFDEQEFATKIKIIGVGGGGGNAVNTMIEHDLSDVEFIVVNSDIKDLKKSRAKIKLQLGRESCKGHGTGAKPDIGEKIAQESEEEIKSLLKDTDLLFIAAGMGGGTGTGASPVIASIARKLNILTVGVVSFPYTREGTLKKTNAIQGIKKLKEEVNTLIIFQNDVLRTCYPDLTYYESYKKSDEILLSAVKAFHDVINTTGYESLDFADLREVISQKGYALIGIGNAEGEGRSIKAAKDAITNPLLDSLSLETC